MKEYRKIDGTMGWLFLLLFFYNSKKIMFYSID